MRLTVTHSYPAAPRAVVAMLRDEAFQRRLCAATGDPDATVDIAGSRVHTARRLPTDRFPDAMRKLVGDHVIADQTTTWDAAGHEAAVVVQVLGTPVRLDAVARVAGDGASTTVTYDGTLAAKVPLIGGSVERAAEPVVRRALEEEQRVGSAWLAER